MRKPEEFFLSIITLLTKYNKYTIYIGKINVIIKLIIIYIEGVF